MHAYKHAYAGGQAGGCKRGRAGGAAGVAVRMWASRQSVGADVLGLQEAGMHSHEAGCVLAAQSPTHHVRLGLEVQASVCRAVEGGAVVARGVQVGVHAQDA